MAYIDLESEVIGIPLDECFVCGKAECTRHHVIPKEFHPKRNVTIPLCIEHKDVTHTIVKQLFFPKKLRLQISKMNKSVDNMKWILKSMQTNLNFDHKYRQKKIKTTTNIPIG